MYLFIIYVINERHTIRIDQLNRQHAIRTFIYLFWHEKIVSGKYSYLE